MRPVVSGLSLSAHRPIGPCKRLFAAVPSRRRWWSADIRGALTLICRIFTAFPRFLRHVCSQYCV
jgi:hypothetical protein